jgi:hypothetical protein
MIVVMVVGLALVAFAIVLVIMLGVTITFAWKPMLYGFAAVGGLAAGAWLLGYQSAAEGLCFVLPFVPALAIEWET